MSESVLATGSYWRELGERLGRQAAQVALPIVFAAGTTGGINLKVALIALCVALVVTVLKTLSGVNASADEPLAWRLIDRAVPAVAGTLLGFVPVDLASLQSVDWSHVAAAALAAGIMSLLAYYLTPPTTAPGVIPPADPPPPPLVFE